MAVFQFSKRPEYNIDQVKEELRRLGHFNVQFDGNARPADVKSITERDVEFHDALRSFQSFTGLVEDGELGPRSAGAITHGVDAFGFHRECGCPDIEFAVEEANIPNGTWTWPNPERTITAAYNFDSLPGLSAADTRAAYQKALADISSKIGVTMRLSEWSQAEVQITLRGLSGGTLAIAELSKARRGTGSHRQWYDSSNRRWSASLAQEVICHETLHTLGFSHSRSSADIMYPTASGRKIVMQPGDVRRGLAAYPWINGEPEPEPTPAPGADLKFTGMVYGADGVAYKQTITLERI